MAKPMNDDILIAIMDVLVVQSARSTAAGMMLLCRGLYHEGGKLLLSSNVDLRTSSQVSSFIAFCLAENASRAAYVQSLTFTISPLPSALASELAEVVPMLTGLRKLVLTRTDLFLRGQYALSRAIASLTSLKDLSLLKGSTSGDLLVTLQSSLRSLTLFEVMVPRGLAGVRSLSNVSTLDVIYLWMDLLVLKPYIDAFPHLSRLSVTRGSLRDRRSNNPGQAAFPDTMSGPQDTQNLRCINQDAQVDGGGWKVLEDLDTDLTAAWILGLSCKVTRLILYVPPDRDLRLLPEVLKDVRPESLELTLAGEGFLQHVVSVPPSLDSVTLIIPLCEQDVGALKRCVEHLAQCFASSDVQRLRLRFSKINLYRDESSGQQTLSRLDDVDVEGWIHSIRHTIPSLADVEVEI